MSARESALRVLTACRTNGAWADAALAAELNRQALRPSDAALASRIVYGVLQNRMLLDHYIGQCCRQRLSHLQQPLPDILRIGAYQILFLDKVPDNAAVSESVELAKLSKRGSASGLVNAVLRQLARRRDSLQEPAGSAAERLSVLTSHPLWLVERLISLSGESEARRFLESDNEIAPVCIQPNPLETDSEALLRELSEAGIAASPHPWVPDCLELRGVGDLTTLPAFYRGKFIVQDAAARLVSLVAGVRPEQRILDVCAAPGGKSFSAAFALRNAGQIIACDLHENKLKRIRDGATRLGLTCISTESADGRVFRPEWEAGFDVVLCDVPCSGLGVIRKKPDIRYKQPSDFAPLPSIQRAILENSAGYVKPGGVLIYSTCTVLPEENGDVTGAFLERNERFSKETFELPGFSDGSNGEASLWPQRHGTDGFYICKMRRNA